MEGSKESESKDGITVHGLLIKIDEFEEKLQQARDTHCRLADDARQHKSEVEYLRSERERLVQALTDSDNLVRQLKTVTSLASDAVNNTHALPIFEDNQTESESFELLPRRLVTVILCFTVIPFIFIA